MRKLGASRIPSNNLFVDGDTFLLAGDTNDSFRWSSEATLRPPTDVSKLGKSFVKPDLVGSYSSPLSSFLAFLLPKVFKSIAVYVDEKEWEA